MAIKEAEEEILVIIAKKPFNREYDIKKIIQWKKNKIAMMRVEAINSRHGNLF